MAKIFAVANQKGGVGKTTTCINLAASLAAMKRRVLLVDLDPQGNATMGSGVDKHELENSVYDLLIDQLPVSSVSARSEVGGYDVVPANGDLTAAEVHLLEVDGKERRMRAALEQVSGDYDYVLIDCPPSLNMLTLNGLVAADGVIIAVQCEYFALEGLSALVRTIEMVRTAANADLAIAGVLRTMYDPRNSLTNDVSAQLQEFFGDKLYRTVIPRNVRLAEAPSHGLPVVHYDSQSRGAKAYLALSGELIRREEYQSQVAVEAQSETHTETTTANDNAGPAVGEY